MRKVAVQVLFWSLFFLGWLQVVYFYVDNIFNRLLFTAFDVIQIMLVFYVTYLFITPRLFFRKNKWWFIAAVPGIVVIAGLLLVYIMQFFLHNMIVPIRFNFTWNYSDLVANRYIIAVLGVLAGFIGKLFIEWFRARRKIEEAERIKVATELMYLKTQVNPHFLFNAINTVYIQIDESAETAKHTLSAFSGMLRYQLYECNQEKVPIEKEVAYLQDYISLQQMRKEEEYEISFTFSEHLQGFMIAPFILIPAIENMFKHAGENNQRAMIKGILDYQNNQLSFYGINTKEQHNGNKSAGGIGLANMQRRLELIYPGQHSLRIKDSAATYEIWLTLQPI